jgi:AcrR family transcriptional regulator
VSEQEDRRTALLGAARTCFAERGYEQTSVARIVSAAGVAQGTFYLYFPAKEALPGALARQLSEELERRTDQLAAHAETLEDALTAAVRATYDAFAANRDVITIANRGIELAPDFDAWLEMTAPHRAALERIVHRFVEADAVDPALDVEQTAFVLRDLLDRAAKAVVVFGREDYGQATTELLLRALGA